MDRDNVAGAALRFREAVRLTPDSVKANYNLGNALSRMNSFPEAQHFYEQALARSPADPRILNNLAYVLLKQGRHADAIGHYRRVLELDPDNAGAAHNLETALRMAAK